MALTITVTNAGGFVAHAKLSWKRQGFNETAESGSLTAGTNWVQTLKDDVTEVLLHCEHDTGLVWHKRNVTYQHVWSNPATEWKNGQAHVKLYGTTLAGYGGDWTDKP